MPLILIVGFPSSGKTTRALEIKKFFEQEFKSDVVLINEESFSIDKNEGYKDYAQEKMTRALLKSNVEKNLNDKTIVILDSLNYIKGYRYELFCLVRSAKTTHCIVFCNTKLEKCLEYQKLHENSLTPEMTDDFYKRMEIPNQKNRWDSPLFELRDNEPTPVKEIANTILFEAKKAKDPISTKAELKFDSNFLFEMDKRIQEIINVILQKENEIFMQGVAITFKGYTNKLYIKNNLSIIELKKFKQEFINICKQNPPKSLDGIGDNFIAYLQTVLERI